MFNFNTEYFEIFDYLTDILVFVKNEKGEFIKANTGFLNTFGFDDRKDVIGKTDQELFGSKFAGIYTIGDQKILSGELSVFHREESIFINNFSSATKYLTTKYPIKDDSGKILAVIGLSRSILNLREATKSSNHLKKALDYIDENYMNEIKVGTLSYMSHMSDSTFLRTFKKEFSLTPKRYIIFRRLKKVAELLVYSDKTFYEISICCGFSDQSHMARAFRRLIGTTPSAYQRRMKQKQHSKS